MYLRPETLGSAVQSLAEHGGLIMAGGTDLFPAHVARVLPAKIIDITRVRELQGISITSDHIRFGGAVSWSEVLRCELPPAFEALKAAAREIGSIQIQNRGTIAGNLCNASPAADSIPPLLSLNADVELASRRGVRRLKLEEFLTGYRNTARTPDEILSAVIVPRVSPRSRSAFLKLGSRRYLVISIIMAATVLEVSAGGRIEEVRIALGAASPVARRLRSLEDDLRGRSVQALSAFEITHRHLESLSPIDDVRATASYRLDTASELIRRALNAAVGDQHV